MTRQIKGASIWPCPLINTYEIGSTYVAVPYMFNCVLYRYQQYGSVCDVCLLQIHDYCCMSWHSFWSPFWTSTTATRLSLSYSAHMHSSWYTHSWCRSFHPVYFSKKWSDIFVLVLHSHSQVCFRHQFCSLPFSMYSAISVTFPPPTTYCLPEFTFLSLGHPPSSRNHKMFHE